MTLAFRSTRIVTPDGEVDGAVLVDEDGSIEAVLEANQLPSDLEQTHDLIDVGSDAILPGGVDTHVHCNEPGRTDWEGFDSATASAAAGGITTIVDMPLNSLPPTTTVDALELKRAAAEGVCHVDYAFWGGAIGENAADLSALLDAGVKGLKCFLADSGVEEFPRVGEDELRAAMSVLSEFGCPMLVHAELPEDAIPDGDPCEYSTWLASRPPRIEVSAIELSLRIALEQQCALHIVHLATAEALDMLLDARNDMPVTFETCPHYITFAAEDIPRGATEYKCAPPIRERAERDALVTAAVRGDIDMICSDHSPCPPGLKLADQGNFLLGWGGIASLQVARSATWTALSEAGGSLPLLARLTSDEPALLAGVDETKGAIAEGLDADLVVFDPDATYSVDPTMLRHRHPVTPYAGRTLRGVVRQTWLRGQLVYADDLTASVPARGSEV
jgi:allantoinase